MVVPIKSQFLICSLARLPRRRGGAQYAKSIYRYFEKRCWIKCTQQPRNVSGVVLSSLFFKEI